jgi:WD40 repeat protein
MPDNTRLICYSGTGKINVLDPETGTFEQRFDLSDSNRVFTITPDGKRLISASSDSTVKVWDMTGYRGFLKLTGHNGAIGAFTITPDGKRLISASSDSTVKVWDMTGGEEPRILNAGFTNYDTLIVTPDNTRLICYSGTGRVKVWDLVSGEEIKALNDVNSGTIDPSLRLRITPEGTRLISFDFNTNLIQVWDLNHMKKLKELKGLDDRKYMGQESKGPDPAFTITPDNTRLIYYSYSTGKIKVQDLNTGDELLELTGFYRGKYKKISVTPDNIICYFR